MPKIDDGGPVFPGKAFETVGGMSLRDYFAAQVLTNPSLSLWTGDSGWSEHTVAKMAYIVADAMIKRRSA